MGDKVQLERGFNNTTFSAEQILTKILEKWESCKGEEATIENLCQILDDADFKMVSGMHNMKFPIVSGI